MKIDKRVVNVIIGLIFLVSFVLIGNVPTVEFGDYGLLQHMTAIGFLMSGLILIAVGFTDKIYDRNNPKYYYQINALHNFSKVSKN